MDRRTLIRRAAAGGAVAWVAPAVFHVDGAAAMVSCPGSELDFSPPNSPDPAAIDSCGWVAGDDGHLCPWTGGVPTGTETINLLDMASHTSLRIVGTLTTDDFDNGKKKSDIVIVHVDGVVAGCLDGFNGGHSVQDFDFSVEHTACSATINISACIADPSTESWSYSGVIVTLT